MGIMLMIAFAASVGGIATPIGTPSNAMVYGSGLIPIRSMIRAGIFFDLIGFFVIWGGLRRSCPPLGWA